MINKDILDSRFIGCDSDYDSATAVLIGAGFDGTTSYRPGTRFGGKVIREQSFGLETYSPKLDKDMSDIKVFDSGELELPFGNTEKILDIIYRAHKQIHSDNKLPVMLGGEHLVTLPAVKAAYEKYPDLRVLHYDAHADLRDMYLDERLSHACVIRRCHELFTDNADKRVYSCGVRSGTREEFEWGKEHITAIAPYEDIDDLKKVNPDLSDCPVYLTIDIDVLEPSVFPATGTPEAGGIFTSFRYLCDNIQYRLNTLNIVGIDIVEYSPPYDGNGVCAAMAGKLLREILLGIEN